MTQTVFIIKQLILYCSIVTNKIVIINVLVNIKMFITLLYWIK